MFFTPHKPQCYPQNPNPHAKIGFIIFYPFQFYALKNIYAQFKYEAEFIVHDSPREEIAGRGLRATVGLLREKGVYFRILGGKRHASGEMLKRFFSRYDALVGLTFTYCCVRPERSSIRKIRVEYGAGKDLWKFHPLQSKLNSLLLYGERSAELYKFYTHYTIVGNTRFDDWFNDTLDRNFINKTRAQLDSSKKTIFYVPTHGELSFLDELVYPLSSIKKRFNVIIKLHHRTICDEPQKITSLREKGFTVFDDTTDSLPLYKIADVVLGDNSSALLEALLAKKPLVIADFFSKEFLEDHRIRFRHHKNKILVPQTYSGSIEQQLKNKVAFCVKNPSELEKALEHALASPDKFAAEREEITRKVFAFNDGRCSLRAKAAIENFLALKEPPPKQILYYIFDACVEETRIETMESIKKMTLFRKLKFIFQNLL
ncbi:MAG: hypothetical protein A3H69_02350 [Candidatus Sungbacteria bacterium RIFCSPLOWO2_02_FULL_47_9]|uniref:CDP-glycerol glycerophosphotransferase n=1 Tax=Candidatus Sungbacteria bacterium RIFCSPHIGHO2_01_FULL_47_32 TaxID=1802264 RepID=A0A1G2K6B8_9BACT|nr:MAG: CDP-Glycerol:Poly(Glycerophosphate) glycerophosphotransferase family protein [Parcubacteria group bacterium GW2011_GWA2_47_10]OGZ94982.1 MAG: hypothetical protein A2633_05970 [Candidatus Sungbacteria bacterium RIFCSPHIGHO2_01_FULL_47_32]OGZ99403.1 MAG: hypothetical protein A3D57_00910 [Candidatus Sungbacteria bacterium RIFCSPHIGHO2_02_FULL_46_12]OHA05646.1 MAG: hypothetical protein A3A28_04350 [Candidatus Sungbacteria bacterium RIFCSPLOWO2_01_FULL_47_32]OHA11534.1 MAG: hypothetical prot